MTKRETSKLKMYRAVNALCLAHPGIVSVIVAFKNAATMLGALITAIDAAAMVESESTKVVTSAKDRLKLLLTQLTADVAAALGALAYSTNNDELKALVKYSLTDLKKMPEETLVRVSTTILELAEQYKTEIDAFGIPAAVIDSLKQTITGYAAAVPTPRNALARRKAAKQKIKSLMQDTDDLLKQQMDKMGQLLKKDYADFYSEYRTNRKIVNAGVTHTSVRGMVVNKATGAAVYNAMVEIEGADVVVHTNLAGEFDSGKLKHGIYNIRVSAPGCIG